MYRGTRLGESSCRLQVLGPRVSSEPQAAGREEEGRAHPARTQVLPAVNPRARPGARRIFRMMESLERDSRESARRVT